MSEGRDMEQDVVREAVRERYAAAARAVAGDPVADAGCCSAGSRVPDALEVDERWGAGLYADGEIDGLPAAALAASLGCGNPMAVADLRPGERVLDLGSGGGIDVLLSARRVGSTGFAYGVDMTEEMLALARVNAAKAGATNVEFRRGEIEALPFDDGSVDVVISNCVVNLSPDKPAVLAEAFRVLAPGGRFGISDVVAEDHLAPAQRAERGSHVGCIAGALSVSEYLDGLRHAGFVDPEVVFTHEVAEGMHGAIVRAAKPEAPVEAAGACCTATEKDGCCTVAAAPSCCGGAVDHLPATCGCR
jgi:arsenite methyltransferase